MYAYVFMFGVLSLDAGWEISSLKDKSGVVIIVDYSRAYTVVNDV